MFARKNMSKILFINCYDDMMLALRTMKAQLECEGHEVHLLALRHLEDCFTPCNPPLMHEKYNYSLQTTQVEADLVMEMFHEIDPDWVGFSVTSNHIGLINYLGNLFKEAKPGIPIVWGGADVWFNTEDDVQYADILVLAEADAIITDLAKAIDGDISLSEVPGIWYKDKSGDLHKNPKVEAFEDLDSLPPGDWSLDRFYEVSADKLWKNAYHPHSMVSTGFRTIMTARGCPFTCSFCCNGFEKEEVTLSRLGRQRSVDHVITEIKALMKQCPEMSTVFFSDEIFPMNRRWVEEFADIYSREIGLSFVCYAYPTTVKDWFADALAGMGDAFVQMGVQTGSDRLNAEVFHRFAKGEDALRAGRIMADRGVMYSVDLIGYNPFETEEDSLQTLDLILQMPRPFNCQAVYELMFWRNFPITDRAIEKGFPLRQTNEHTWLSEPKKEYRFWHAMIVIAAFSKSMSKKLAMSFVENPKYRDDPEILHELMMEISNMKYMRTPYGAFQIKDKHIQDLENYYFRIEGSRAISKYMAAKQRIRNWIESGFQFKQNLLTLPSRIFNGHNDASLTEGLESIFDEHRSDVERRKAGLASDGSNGTGELKEGVPSMADGIVGTQGPNGTALAKTGIGNGKTGTRRSTRKKFQYPKAGQVRVGRAAGDVKRED